MKKIATHYTHAQVQALYSALEEAVRSRTRTFEAECRYANEINNVEGAGITFDYYTPTPMPSWITAARLAMLPFIIE